MRCLTRSARIWGIRGPRRDGLIPLRSRGIGKTYPAASSYPFPHHSSPQRSIGFVGVFLVRRLRIRFPVTPLPNEALASLGLFLWVRLLHIHSPITSFQNEALASFWFSIGGWSVLFCRGASRSARAGRTRRCGNVRRRDAGFQRSMTSTISPRNMVCGGCWV